MMIKKTKEIEVYLTYSKKLQVLKYAKEYGNNSIAYKFFGVKKSTIYKWKKAYEEHGEEALLRKKPTHRTFSKQIKQEIVNKILELRKEHKLGTWRAKWYLERHHDIFVSESSVYRTLKRDNVAILDRKIT